MHAVYAMYAMYAMDVVLRTPIATEPDRLKLATPDAILLGCRGKSTCNKSPFPNKLVA